MPCLQLARQILNTDTLVGEEHNQVVKHVATLVNKLLLGAVCRLHNGLYCFLAHLLAHLVHPFLKQFGGIAALGHFLIAFLNKVLQFCEESQIFYILVA